MEGAWATLFALAVGTERVLGLGAAAVRFGFLFQLCRRGVVMVSGWARGPLGLNSSAPA